MYFVVTLLTSVLLQKNLLILDGDSHCECHKIQEDENRNICLEILGFTVLSFENRFVFGILDN